MVILDGVFAAAAGATGAGAGAAGAAAAGEAAGAAAAGAAAGAGAGALAAGAAVGGGAAAGAQAAVNARTVSPSLARCGHCGTGGRMAVSPPLATADQEAVAAPTGSRLASAFWKKLNNRS